jgi:hypothetical protein
LMKRVALDVLLLDSGVVELASLSAVAQGERLEKGAGGVLWRKNASELE